MERSEPTAEHVAPTAEHVAPTPNVPTLTVSALDTLVPLSTLSRDMMRLVAGNIEAEAVARAVDTVRHEHRNAWLVRCMCDPDWAYVRVFVCPRAELASRIVTDKYFRVLLTDFMNEDGVHVNINGTCANDTTLLAYAERAVAAPDGRYANGLAIASAGELYEGLELRTGAPLDRDDAV